MLFYEKHTSDDRVRFRRVLWNATYWALHHPASIVIHIHSIHLHLILRKCTTVNDTYTSGVAKVILDGIFTELNILGYYTEVLSAMALRSKVLPQGSLLAAAGKV